MIVEDAVKLSIYFGDAHTTSDQRLTCDALLDCLEKRKLILVALFRGIEGFGIGRRIHTTRFPDISVDLPLVAVAIDHPARIHDALEDVDRVTSRGLVTLEYSALASADDAPELPASAGVGNAHELTVYCGRGEKLQGRPGHRVIVDTLGRYGAAGATTLFGVDGAYHGQRERAYLFGRNRRVPAAIVSVGPEEPMRQALAELRRLHSKALLTLERVSLLKHDGELLDEPPSPKSLPEQDHVWQTIKIYTRQSAQVGGHALYTALTRRLREAGASGVTTLLGDWGFSSDEEPFGDRLLPGGHRPTVSILIDRPAKIAEMWPMIDELTADHGIVTSHFVPGYRERADQLDEGRLSIPDRELVIGELASRESTTLTPPRARVSSDPHSPEERWLSALIDEAEAFAHSRRRRRPLIRVTLTDGEVFFLASAGAEPGDGFVTLHPHPHRVDELVPGEDGNPALPRALVVPLGSIDKIELLARTPRGTRSSVEFS